MRTALGYLALGLIVAAAVTDADGARTAGFALLAAAGVVAVVKVIALTRLRPARGTGDR
jgi:hypothetical protein